MNAVEIRSAMLAAALCTSLIRLCGCDPVTQATDFEIRTGTCGPLCAGIAKATGRQVGPTVTDLPQFKAEMDAAAAVHHMPAPKKRQIDLSGSPLSATDRNAVLRELGPTFNVVKVGDDACDVYILQHPAGGEVSCLGGQGSDCPVSLELNKAEQPPAFDKIYSPAVPTGTQCSATSCGRHPS